MTFQELEDFRDAACLERPGYRPSVMALSPTQYANYDRTLPVALHCTDKRSVHQPNLVGPRRSVVYADPDVSDVTIKEWAPVPDYCLP